MSEEERKEELTHEEEQQDVQSSTSDFSDYDRILLSTVRFLSEMIKNLNLKEARQLLLKLENKDIARVISHMKPSERIIAFRVLPQDLAVEVFSEFEPKEQEELISSFTNEESRDILENMDPDDRTDFFEELPAFIVKRLVKLLSAEERQVAIQLLNYPDDSAGRIMTPEYVDFEEDITVDEALKIIREEAPDKETIYTCYVTNKSQILVGVVSLRSIITAAGDQKISEIMSVEPTFVYTYQDQQEVAKIIKDYDFLAIPVVDHNQRLVGIVTVDDIFDVLEEENTEDFQLIAAIQPTDEGYLKSNFWKLIFNRSIWIVGLLLVGSIAQDIINSYRTGFDTAFYGSLSLFFTILIGVAGNIGSQSSILVIRGLATGEIGRGDTMRLLVRSLLMGVVMGLVLAGFMLLRVVIFKTGQDVKWVVSIALASLVMVANFLGATLPLLIKKMGVDPALVSSPLITTLIDVGGLVLYFEVARLILKFV